MDIAVTSTLATHNTHPYQRALLSSCQVLLLQDPSKISALVFPRSSTIILSDWFLHAPSYLAEDQGTCEQLRVVSPAQSHIIITRMTEPVGSHESQQTSPNASEQAHEPNTNSPFLLKAELCTFFPSCLKTEWASDCQAAQHSLESSPFLQNLRGPSLILRAEP